MKTAEEILQKSIGNKYLYCVQKPFTDEYFYPTKAIYKSMEEYAQQRVEEATRWIPVSERLPVEDEIVLCYYDGEVFTCYIQILYSDGTARFKQPYGMFSANMYNIPVTHWQPLPKAPTV